MRRRSTAPGVKFIYIPCADLAAMRVFYSTLIGLDEIYHSDEERSVAYRCESLQFSITEHPDAMPDEGDWAVQPGWRGGTAAAASWSVELDEPAFRSAVQRLIDAGVEARHAEPQWVSYWSFPVRDPMGNTVEVTYAPS